MSNEKKKRVLVAGATGYLGKFAVKAFKERGYSVRALTRSEERLAEFLCLLHRLGVGNLSLSNDDLALFNRLGIKPSEAEHSELIKAEACHS